jgi:hypothetical protein
VLLKIIYLLVCPELGLFVLMFRTDLVKDAELLVLRREYAVLRRKARRIRYEPADRVRFAALAQLILRGRRAEVFPVTPATLLAWHRKTGRQEGRHEQTAQAGPAAGSPQHSPHGHPAGEGESAVGRLPAHSRRADQARRQDRAVHRL